MANIAPCFQPTLELFPILQGLPPAPPTLSGIARLEAVKESRFPRRKCLFGFVGAAAFLWPHERACEA